MKFQQAHIPLNILTYMFFDSVYPCSSKSDKQVGSFSGVIQGIADRHMNPDSSTSSFFAKHLATQKNSPAFKQQIRRIVEEWKPEVIVPQHGDVIEKNGTEAVKKIFGFALE